MSLLSAVMARGAEPNHVLTGEQEAIYAHCTKMADGDALLLNARAGCAKTYTMVGALPRMYRPGDRGLILTFSKANSEELKRKVPSWCEASTFHSLAVRNTVAPLEFSKLWDMIKAKGGVSNRKLQAPVKQLVSLGKNLAIGLPGEQPDTLAFWTQMLETYGIKHPKRVPAEEVAFQAQRMFRRSLEYTATGDFDDQLYWLARDGFPANTPPYTLIAVDEFQDTNPTQLVVLDQAIALAKGRCRIIGPGDPAQAIFGWRGAGVDSFEQGVKRFKADVMTLTVSQRCPHTVIAEAQTLVPDIMAKGGAANGMVAMVPMADFSIDYVEDGHVVLCRNNAPLLALALDALRKNRKVAIQGKDLATKTLQAFRTIFHWGRVPHHIDRAFTSRQLALKDELEDQPFALANALESLETAKAMWEILQERNQDPFIWKDFSAFLDYAQTTMGRLFFDPEPGKPLDGIVLSTIHRAKGLEWDVVWFYDPNLIPSKSAKALGGWHLQQEDNLKYVAITRAKDSLIYVR